MLNHSIEHVRVIPQANIQPESLTWFINQLLRSPDKMKSLALAGQNRIKRSFAGAELRKQLVEEGMIKKKAEV